MATAEQIKSLVKAFVARDDSKFKTVVLQIAAQEAKLGHSNIAQELKKEVSNLEVEQSAKILKLSPQSPMLEFSNPSVRLSELIASDEIVTKIKRVLFTST